jgi:hypothetical protein
MRWVNRGLLHGLPLIVVGAAACIGGQTGSEAREGQGLGNTEECDPFGASAPPIALETVLGVGQAADGTVYVVDERQEPIDHRAFVIDGTALVRLPASGASSSSEPGRQTLAIAVGTTPPFRLLVEIADDGTTRMARTERTDRVIDIDALTAEERLETLDADALDGYTVRNLPPDVRVEYFARTEQGELLLVIAPNLDWSYDKFRLFYGADGLLVERKLDEVIRRRDGGTTNLLFTLDAQAADAFFPIERVNDMFQPGPATLNVGDTTLDLDRLDPITDRALIDDVKFRCLR